MKQITITLLKPSDWELYKAIRLEALKNDPQAFGASYDESTHYAAEIWKKRLTDSLVYIAHDQEKPIGLLGVYFKNEKEEKIAHLWGMYVNKDYRGLGIGKQLMQKALDEIKKTPEIQRVQLMVEHSPTPAQELYKSFGFRSTGTTEYVLGDSNTHTLYIMELTLK